jgi:hypothetical protein
MAYKNASSQNGVASYNHFFQLNTTQIAALTAQEGLDADSFDVAGNKAKYGMCVYQVNQVPINLSGDVNVDGTITGYDHINEAQVDSGHNLWVKDQAMLINFNYSRIIQKDANGNTYIAHAEIGSLSGDPVWRAQKIDAAGSRMWADDAAFTQIADVLSGLSYNF